MNFRYIKIPAPGLTQKWIYRPFIPIRITGPKVIWQGDGLIDSGADRSLFDLQIAKDVGLDLSKSKGLPFVGIGQGKVLGYGIDVDLEVVGSGEKIRIPVCFVPHLGIKALLGQEGFFDAFKITFECKYGTIEIVVNK